MFKRLNDNHKNISNKELWTREKFIHYQEQGFKEWTKLSFNFEIKSIKIEVNENEHVKDILDQNWETIPDTKRILLIENNNLTKEIWEKNQLSFWEKHNKREIDWLYVYLKGSKEFIKPYTDEKLNFPSVIKDREKRSIKSHFKKIDKIKNLLEAFIFGSPDQISVDDILKQANIKDDKYQEWINRLSKANMWEDDEEILQAGAGTVTRSNWKIRSNFTRRGRFLLTTKRFVFIRKKFNIFSLGLASLLPILAYVRPSNKVILFFSTIYQIIKIPLQIIKGFRPVLSAVGAGFVFSLINIGGIQKSLNNFFDRFPSLQFVETGANWGLENPEVLVAFLGIATGLRLALVKTFFRKEEIIVLPLDQLSTLILDERLLIGRWKVKGMKLVNAPENGMEFKLRINNNNRKDSFRHEKLANDVFIKMVNL